jgi:RNA polymerase sigma factor (TIGR02999 family)
MRRILVEQARRKRREKHGGRVERVDLDENQWITSTTPQQMLAVDEAIAKLAEEDATAAEIVKLRYFAAVSLEEAAEMLGIHRATAFRHWAYARAWIRADVQSDCTPAE